MVLIVEPLDPAVMSWLMARHAVRFAPELARDLAALRLALGPVQALVVPATVALDAETLAAAPRLKAVGRLSAGVENIDFEACARLGAEVVRPGDATAPAEAERLRVFRSCPLTTPKRTRSSLQMLAIAWLWLRFAPRSGTF